MVAKQTFWFSVFFLQPEANICMNYTVETQWVHDREGIYLLKVNVNDLNIYYSLSSLSLPFSGKAVPHDQAFNKRLDGFALVDLFLPPCIRECLRDWAYSHKDRKRRLPVEYASLLRYYRWIDQLLMIHHWDSQPKGASKQNHTKIHVALHDLICMIINMLFINEFHTLLNLTC